MPRARVLRGLLALLALGAGALAGLLGSFVHPVKLAHLPVGLVVALALSGSVFVMAGLMLGRAGAVAAAGGWAVPVLLLATQRPEGDLVVPATLAGYGWLLGGFVLALICIVPGYRRRPPPPAVPPSAISDPRR